MIPWENIERKLGDWGSFFKPFYDEGGFEKIYDQLKKDGKDSKIFPNSANLFKCFEICTKKNINCIIVNNEPYQEDINLGMGLSATKMTPALEKVWRGVEIDISDGLNLDKLHFHDLTDWGKEGVMLLNSAMTVVEGKPRSHVELWKPFISYFLETIHLVPTVFLGKQASEFVSSALLMDTLVIEHPMSSVDKYRDWEHKNMFSWINKILKANNNIEVDWYSLPF